MSSNAVEAHPTLSFRNAFVGIGDKHIKNQYARSLFLAATHVWRWLFRIDKKEPFVFEEFAAGRDGFRPKYWIFKSFFYPDYIATFVLKSTGEQNAARMAAHVLHGALTFREHVIQNTVKPEFEKGKPLDMAIYRKLFSRVATTKHVRRRFVQEDVDFEPTDYIVVCVRGFLYRLACLKHGRVLSNAHLFVRISAILEHAQKREGQAKETSGLFGLLTVFVNREHGNLYEELTQNNAQTLDTIDAALFTLSIDVEARPKTPDDVLRTINADHYLNRDNRRSMYLVVTGNGRAGVVVNPHTGVGGVVSATFTDYLYTHARALQQEDAAGNVPRGESTETVEPLVFSTSEAWEASLLRSKAIAESRLYPPNEKSVFALHGVGHQDFRAKKISSDAAFHCAMNLAYLRCFKKVPTTGNFISLRNFRHGDIWRYASSNDAMDSFLQTPGSDTMRAAVDAHRLLVKAQKTAEDEIYHVAMMMLKLVSEFRVPFVAVPALVMIMSLFIRDFSHRFLLLDVWASQIPTKPGLEIAGRGSVFLSFLPRDSIAGHYMIYDDQIHICFLRGLRRKDDAAISAAFVQELERCLHLVKSMVPDAPPVDPAPPA